MNTTEKNKLIAEFMGFNLKEVKLSPIELTENSIELNKYYFDTVNQKMFKCTRTAFPLVIVQDTKEYYSANINNCKEVLFDDLKYNSDWNWLMEVVQKIEKLSINEDLYSFYVGISTVGTLIQPKTKLNYPNNDCGGINERFEGGSKIENTYNACVEFVKWYNEQNLSKI